MNEAAKLLPCPFCGSANIDPEGWVSTERKGPACDDCAGCADTVELWNSRPLSQAGAGGVVVKQLDWVEQGLNHSPTWRAESSFGRYLVYMRSNNSWAFEPPSLFGGKIGFKSPNEAMATAQADYESRIRSALAATPPAPVQTASVEAVAAFLKERDESLLAGEADDAERTASAQEILRLASLTAPTQGDGAPEPVAWRSVLTDMLAALNRYGHETGDGDIPASHRALMWRADQLLKDPSLPGEDEPKLQEHERDMMIGLFSQRAKIADKDKRALDATVFRMGIDVLAGATPSSPVSSPSPAGNDVDLSSAERMRGMKEAIRLARYQLRRGANDLGVGEVDTLLRMVVACGEDGYIPLAEEGSEAAERVGSLLQRAVYKAAQRLSLRRGSYWPTVDPEQQKVYLAEIMSVVATIDEERGGPGHHYGLGYAQGQVDLALDKPNPSPAGGVREALGSPDGWREQREILEGWTRSAFLAGEKVADPVWHKRELYGDLNRLVSWLHSAEDAARVALSSPATGEVVEAFSAEWMEKAREIYERCKCWPEKTPEGLMALLELRNHVFAALNPAPGHGEGGL